MTRTYVFGEADDLQRSISEY
ncbi:hypothetical protein PJW08_03020 [Tenacibaculum finnmarkense]|nr:hypothetical protein PJW08_03020 [Tenacibaculum finnmarkense]